MPERTDPVRLSIIGTGHVGLVTGACFAEKGHRVVCVDNDPRKIDVLTQGRMPIYEPGLDPLVARNVVEGRLSFTSDIGAAVRGSEVIFICVGTPPLPSGEPDMQYLEGVSREIARNLDGYRVIVEKSTVPVQTGDRVRQTIERYVKGEASFDVVSNPEFLREGTAVQDTLEPDRIVVGVSSPRAREVMERVYRPFQSPVIYTDTRSAELIKHASNSFLAMKITFINAVATICEMAGGNVEEVARGMGMDPRIGPAFLRAGIGYGGSCFPKDVDAFASIADKLGYPLGILKEVQRINQDQRARFVKRIEEELWVLKDKKIGVLGLSFKPDTDDVRESPAIDIANRLAAKGAKVRAYDPVATEKARPQLHDVELVSGPFEAAKEADLLVIATEWKEFRDLDLVKLKATLSHPTIFDGRNLFDPARMKELGFRYFSVGRP